MSLTLQELLSLPADPQYYLVFPLLPKGGRVIIGAPAKHFKSMLAMNIAYDLCEGVPILGQECWTPKRPMTVLYVEQEIGRFRVKERMEKIHGLRNGDLAPSNFHIETKGSGIMLDNEIGLNKLKNRLNRLKPDVLILDPLRKFHAADEDSSTEMSKVFRTVDLLQEEYNDLSVIVCHHTGKRSEFRDPSDPESLRGSSFLFDDVDTSVMLTKPVKGNDYIIRLHFVLRSAAAPRPLTLEFDKDTYLFSKVGEK